VFLLFLAIMISPLTQPVLAKQVVITLESEQPIQVHTDSQGERQSYHVPGDAPSALKTVESSQPIKPKLEKSFDIHLAKFVNLASMAVLAGGSIALALEMYDISSLGEAVSALNLKKLFKLSALWYSYRLYTQYKELGETYAGAVRPEIHSPFWFKVGRAIDLITCAAALLTVPQFDKTSPLPWLWGTFIVEKISNTYVRSQEYYARRQNL
jgi:hypothetical protein